MIADPAVANIAAHTCPGGEARDAQCPKEEFLGSFRQLFPCASAPVYANNGGQHSLQFLSVQLVVQRAFATEDEAKRWLYRHACIIASRMHAAATKQIGLDKSKRTNESSRVREVEAVKRIKCADAASAASAIAVENGSVKNTSVQPNAPSRAQGSPSTADAYSALHAADPPDSLAQLDIFSPADESLPARSSQSGGQARGASVARRNTSSPRKLVVSVPSAKNTQSALVKPRRGNESNTSHTGQITCSDRSLLEGYDDFTQKPSQSDSLAGAIPGLSLSQFTLSSSFIEEDNGLQALSGPTFFEGAASSMLHSIDTGNTSDYTVKAQYNEQFTATKSSQPICASASLPESPKLDVPKRPRLDAILEGYADGDCPAARAVKDICIFYRLCHPEYEIVRENDVYCCTATFCGLKFASAYNYNKTECRSHASLMVFEHLKEHWSDIFTADHAQRQEAAKRMR
ncbi:hypothetical protein PAPHI01_1993 [Pancytospora philotis]|nr:hypothetical protein PAPHI01_1993 [Pancytospora philotis]